MANIVDKIMHNGNQYDLPVTSVNSKTGTVTLDADDISDSSTTNKFVTASDKTTWGGKQDKLVAGTNITIAADGKTISATDTTYSPATSSTNGLVKLGSDTVQSVSANAVSGTASRTYALQTNSSGQLVVNIPRTDTTYTASSFDIKDLTDSTNLRTTWSGKADTTIINDTAFGSSWNGDTTHAPTKNAVYGVLGDVETLLAAL